MPKILELDHLTVTGDVYFGRNVTLRGTVIVVANEGQRIDIPDGCILENRLLSGNLNMIVRVSHTLTLTVYLTALHPRFLTPHRIYKPTLAPLRVPRRTVRNGQGTRGRQSITVRKARGPFTLSSMRSYIQILLFGA
jgi:hypothetical protein